MSAQSPDFLVLLRLANSHRVTRFGHGGINDPRGWRAMQWGCALAGEVGELCNVLKKYERRMPTDPSQSELMKNIREEIADVMIYLDLVAAYFNVDLAEAVAEKFDATSKRYGFPERLTTYEAPKG